MDLYNTDSIFSCYRFRENSKKVNKDESLKIWKEVIKFSKVLIKPFIPIEYQYMWESLHEEYYDTSKVKKLELPQSPEVLPKPDHHKTLLPIHERFKQFLKEYMEESYLPWIWTLQDIFTRKYNIHRRIKNG